MLNPTQTELLRRYVADQCSASERQQAEALLATPEGIRQMRTLIDEANWPAEANLLPETTAEKTTLARAWQRLRQTTAAESPDRTVVSLRYRYYGVAAALVGLGLAWTRYALPVSEPATFRQVSASAGQKAHVTLPDGSKVWLNAQSRLRYALPFGRTEPRRVELEGEAYFDVAHDTKHPFIVQSGIIQTRVVGTQFNVRAYADEPAVEVAVLTGQVRVADQQQRAVNLRPNQKSHYDRQTQRLQQQPIANAADYRAWTDDQLVLENSSVAETVRLLNRRFAVNIRVPQHQLERCVLTTRFDHPTLTDVLTVLCTYLNASYRQEGHTIIITGKGC